MPTLKMVLNTYIGYKSLRVKTVSQYRSFIDRCCPEWLDVEVSAIDKRMILDKYLTLVSNESNYASSGGNGQANAVFRILRALFNFASNYWDMTLINPVKAVRTVGGWRQTDDRTSNIPYRQLSEWYRLVSELPSVHRDYFLVVLLTGARAGEISDLAWAEVDLTAGLLHIPAERTKDKKAHHQPVSRQVLHILRERKLLAGQSPYVFSTFESPGEPYSPNRRSQHRIEKALGNACNPHTLRRTFSTIASNQVGIDKFIVKRCLNHANTDITDRYIQRDPEALREPFQQVADFMYLHFRGEKPRIKMRLEA